MADDLAALEARVAEIERAVGIRRDAPAVVAEAEGDAAEVGGGAGPAEDSAGSAPPAGEPAAQE